MKLNVLLAWRGKFYAIVVPTETPRITGPSVSGIDYTPYYVALVRDATREWEIPWKSQPLRDYDEACALALQHLGSMDISDPESEKREILRELKGWGKLPVAEWSEAMKEKLRRLIALDQEEAKKFFGVEVEMGYKPIPDF